jgi:bifunctional enzyme Fae/Hps
MENTNKHRLSPKKHYLQVALNGTLEDAREIIFSLPRNNRIIIEAGTPFIKRYGEQGIRQLRSWYESHLWGIYSNNPENISLSINSSILKGLIDSQMLIKNEQIKNTNKIDNDIFPYIVADMKTMDRGENEVEIAHRGGASAVIALGTAPIETLNSFIQKCDEYGMDAMIDMMNVDYPLSVLRSLKKAPTVVIIHRGVDEEKFNKEKQIPLHEIRRIKGNYNNIMISIAGGDTLREVQRSIFNDAEIVVIWKSVLQKSTETIELIDGFLKVIK